MGKRGAAAAKGAAAKKQKGAVLDGWKLRVWETIDAMNGDKGDHGAKDVCEWFGPRDANAQGHQQIVNLAVALETIPCEFAVLVAYTFSVQRVHQMMRMDVHITL